MFLLPEDFLHLYLYIMFPLLMGKPFSASIHYRVIIQVGPNLSLQLTWKQKLCFSIRSLYQSATFVYMSMIGLVLPEWSPCIATMSPEWMLAARKARLCCVGLFCEILHGQDFLHDPTRQIFIQQFHAQLSRGDHSGCCLGVIDKTKVAF